MQPESIWTGVGSQTSSAEVSRAGGHRPGSGAIGDDTAHLGHLLGLPDRGLTLGRARAYTELALLAENPAKPQPGWLNPAVQAAVGESMTVLGPLTDLVRQHERGMREVFTDGALGLDLAALNTRFRESHRG